MRPLRSLVGAVVASALAGGLWAGPALATQVSGAGAATDEAVVAAFDAHEDGVNLLGDGLLGLDAETVTTLTQADPDFAASVSSGLRSSDPYVIEATVDETSARLAAVAIRSQTQGVITYMINQFVTNNTYVIANHDRTYVIAHVTDSRLPLGSALLSQGLEREQLVSAIHTALLEE